MKHLSGAPLKGRFLTSPTNIKLSRKGLPRTNTLAYYKKFVNYGCITFYNIGQRFQCYITFLILTCNWARVFVPTKTFQPSLMLAVKARNLPKSGAPESCFNQVGFNHTYKKYTWMEILPGTNTLAYPAIRKSRNKKVL